MDGRKIQLQDPPGGPFRPGHKNDNNYSVHAVWPGCIGQISLTKMLTDVRIRQ